MNGALLSILFLFYGILVLLNIPAPFLGLRFESDRSERLWYQPPGFVIPIAWFVLFTLLGIARNTLLQSAQPQLQGWLFALAFLCATYAYYTLGLSRLTGISALWLGLFGNILVIALTALVFIRLFPVSNIRLFPVSKSAAWYTFPVLDWTAYATVIVVGEMKLQKLL